MTNPDIAAVAAGLTKASKRALVRIGTDWTEEGAPGPARSDAYSLGWGRDSKHKLADKTPFAITKLTCRWKWRLTPLGQQVRAFLATYEQAMKEAEHG